MSGVMCSISAGTTSEGRVSIVQFSEKDGYIAVNISPKHANEFAIQLIMLAKSLASEGAEDSEGGDE